MLDLLRAGKMEQAHASINLLNDLQRMLQDLRTNMARKTNALSLNKALAVEARQRTVLWLSISATISTVLLGLVLAALFTQRLTRPVRSLVTAMDEVQHGHLDVELPVISRDEIGALTKAFNFFIGELRAKEHLKQTFGKYIDPRVLQHLIDRDGSVAADGGRRVMTVLFADVVAFSALSERLTPSLMVSMLNRHFGLQSQAVQLQLGVVDKFIGDALMAFWGPPFTDANVHASLACRSSLAQLEALDVLHRELPEITGLRKGLPELDMCIGIATGDVVVGNIGSENARSYTVIGDTVNLASRIEAVNRLYGTRILISEETAHAVGTEFALREIDTITVKGKTEVSRIF
jgi:adenylate cyclase